MYVYLQICVTWGKEQGEETKKEQDFKIDQSRSCRALGDFHSVTTFSNRGLTVTIFLNPAEWLSSGHQSQPLLAGKIPSWTLGAKVLRFSKSQDAFSIFSWPLSTKKHQQMMEKRVKCSPLGCWLGHHSNLDIRGLPSSADQWSYAFGVSLLCWQHSVYQTLNIRSYKAMFAINIL